jgi:hypothetical protein
MYVAIGTPSITQPLAWSQHTLGPHAAAKEEEVAVDAAETVDDRSVRSVQPSRCGTFFAVCTRNLLVLWSIKVVAVMEFCFFHSKSAQSSAFSRLFVLTDAHSSISIASSK